VTWDIGIGSLLRFVEGSCEAKDCNRMRSVSGDAVGRSEVREGGVDGDDWGRELGLRGDELRKEELGLVEDLGKVKGIGDEDSWFVWDDELDD